MVMDLFCIRKIVGSILIARLTPLSIIKSLGLSSLSSD